MKYIDKKILYEAGDWVKLVSDRPVEWNSQGEMDCFLGKVTQLIAVCPSGSIEIDLPESEEWSFNAYTSVERPASEKEIGEALKSRKTPSNYQEDDWVRLVSERPRGWNDEGKMDHFLGKTARIIEIDEIDDGGDRVRFDLSGSDRWFFTTDSILRKATQIEIDRELKSRVVDEIDSKAREYRKGDWLYWRDDWGWGSHLGRVVRVEGSQYGVSLINGFRQRGDKAFALRLATEEEVKKELIEEAKKRYNVGHAILSTCTGVTHVLNEPGFNSMFEYSVSLDQLCWGVPAVYTEGVWAKFDRDFISIGDHIVIISLNSKGGRTVEIGCKRYSANKVKRLLESMEELNIDSIEAEGQIVSRTTVKKIVAKVDTTVIK